MFLFGIEHEVAFLNQKGEFADFSRTKFNDLSPIIDMLPVNPCDYLQLCIGDAGIKRKRWYIKGSKHFVNSHRNIECIPKGIEIRTSVHNDITSAIAELSESFILLREAAGIMGFSPVLVSFNPYQSTFKPSLPPGSCNCQQNDTKLSPKQLNQQMLTYGADLNISLLDSSYEQIIDIAHKLIYWSPYIIPFSFSSPFYQGRVWDGLSIRSFSRSNIKSPVRVFVEKEEQLITSNPNFTKIARLPTENFRIEFQACDSCDDFFIYAGLLALIKGLILDESLHHRATTPNIGLHQLSAKEGFKNPDIYRNAQDLLEAAENALDLNSDLDAELLMPLKVILEHKETPAHELIWVFKQLGSIEEVLKHTYIAYNSINLN
ncbi:MAG: glutamate-cysteine ligase family protein [Cyanobacteria bacterium P01_A01_bin.45]